MNKYIRQKAIVLRRTNFGEADRIIHFITPDGELSALAKGVRKQNSKLAGGIEPFCLTDIVVVKGKSELYSLTGAKLIKYYDNIIKDFDRMEFAYGALSTVSKSSKGLGEGKWFEILADTLKGVDRLDVDLKVVKAWFYINITNELGDELNLRTDADGLAIDESKKYIYDVEQKSLVANNVGNITTNHLKLMRIISKGDMSLIARITGISEYLDEVLEIASKHFGL